MGLMMQLDPDRLAEIDTRLSGFSGYLWSLGGRRNTGACYSVSGYRPGILGNPTCPEIRGPEAYFSSYDDADMYRHLVTDLLWLREQYEELSQAIARNI